MLSDFILGLISIILDILHGVLSLIPLTVPIQVSQAFAYFAGYLAYAGGIIDIPGVFLAFNFLLNFLVAWFTFKGILWAYHLVMSRSVHHKQALPAQSQSNN